MLLKYSTEIRLPKPQPGCQASGGPRFLSGYMTLLRGKKSSLLGFREMAAKGQELGYIISPLTQRYVKYLAKNKHLRKTLRSHKAFIFVKFPN